MLENNTANTNDQALHETLDETCTRKAQTDNEDSPRRKQDIGSNVASKITSNLILPMDTKCGNRNGSKSSGAASGEGERRYYSDFE